MKKTSTVSWRAGLAIACLGALPVYGVCEGAKRDLVATGTALKAEPADPRVSAALRAIDAGAVRRDIEALVGFGNRSTLGSVAPVGVGTQSAGRGGAVGGGPDWGGMGVSAGGDLGGGD